MKIALLALSVLALSACDSTSSDPEEDLLGTWTLASVRGQSVLTVSKTQTAVDLSEPSEGAFTVSGTVSGEIRYLDQYYRSHTSAELRLTSYDPTAETYPPNRLSLLIEDRDGHSTIFLRWEGTSEGLEFYAPLPTSFRDDPAIDLDVSLYPATGGEPSVHIVGTFSLGQRTLVANEPTGIQVELDGYSPSSTTRYRFEERGVLVIQKVSGNRTVEHRGTWERNGDRVVLTTQEEDGLVSEDYRVEREGNSLILVIDQYNYDCDSACLARAETSYDLEPGTLLSVTHEGLYQFEPAPLNAN